MHSLPQEFLALCRHLGDVQKRCSATVAAQAAQIDALQAQVLRLRAPADHLHWFDAATGLRVGD